MLVLAVRHGQKTRAHYMHLATLTVSYSSTPHRISNAKHESSARMGPIHTTLHTVQGTEDGEAYKVEEIKYYELQPEPGRSKE